MYFFYKTRCHADFVFCLQWSLLGNLVLPRDLFLSLGEEALAAASRGEVGHQSKLLGELWAKDDVSFAPVKEQYIRMLSSTPDARAVQWKKKIGIEDQTLIRTKRENANEEE